MTEPEPNISFEDTAIAFSYKTDAELRNANFIFSLVNHPWVSSMATGFVKTAFKLRLPVEGVIRSTAFAHFCGGESIEASEKVIQKLGSFNVGTVLDYSVEGEDSEADFDHTVSEILQTQEKARHSAHIPFSVFKVTGIASAVLLEKVQQRSSLNKDEELAIARFHERVDRICAKAYELDIPVLIDAEDSWIQDPIDAVADAMMAKYNKKRAIVFNTYQLYRTASFSKLKKAHEDAVRGGYFLGAKLVRGAYMEKERERAKKMDYPSPIQPDKAATDKAFDDALTFCIQNIDRVAVMCGSHNDNSNLHLARLMATHQVARDDQRVWFAQLYGMSDNISFNLAKAGYRVAKYVPYGPVRSVMPYLLRRAEENTSVAGQSSRELMLIRKELRRRKASR